MKSLQLLVLLLFIYATTINEVASRKTILNKSKLPLDNSYEDGDTNTLGESSYSSCNQILSENRYARSGIYVINMPPPFHSLKVFCEMNIDNGGYTFYPTSALLNGSLKKQILTITNKKRALLYFKDRHEKIKFGVLGQLSEFLSQNLTVEIADDTGSPTQATKCQNAVNGNSRHLGRPFLCLQFQDISTASNVQNRNGLYINGNEVTFKNCDRNPNSYMAFFPKFSAASNYLFNYNTHFFNSFLDSLQFHPSQNYVPDNFFYFFEMHFGGCGIYSSTDGRPSIRNFMSAAIGFK